MRSTGAIIEYDKIAELGRIKDGNSNPAIRALFRRADCDAEVRARLDRMAIPPQTLPVSYDLTLQGADWIATAVTLAAAVLQPIAAAVGRQLTVKLPRKLTGPRSRLKARSRRSSKKSQRNKKPR
jgi:hypothetical protein